MKIWAVTYDDGLASNNWGYYSTKPLAKKYVARFVEGHNIDPVYFKVESVKVVTR